MKTDIRNPFVINETSQYHLFQNIQKNFSYKLLFVARQLENHLVYTALGQYEILYYILGITLISLITWFLVDWWQTFLIKKTKLCNIRKGLDDDDDDSMSDNNLHWVSVTAKLDYHKIYSCTRYI